MSFTSFFIVILDFALFLSRYLYWIVGPNKKSVSPIILLIQYFLNCVPVVTNCNIAYLIQFYKKKNYILFKDENDNWIPASCEHVLMGKSD